MNELFEFNDEQPQSIRFDLDDFPRQSESTQTAWFDSEAVVFHVATQMVHQLSAMAAATWMLCDGDSSVRQMTDELAVAFAKDPHETHEHLQTALSLLANQGLLDTYTAPEHHLLQPIEERGADGSWVITPPPDP